MTCDRTPWIGWWYLCLILYNVTYYGFPVVCVTFYKVWCGIELLYQSTGEQEDRGATPSWTPFSVPFFFTLSSFHTMFLPIQTLQHWTGSSKEPIPPLIENFNSPSPDFVNRADTNTFKKFLNGACPLAQPRRRAGRLQSFLRTSKVMSSCPSTIPLQSHHQSLHCLPLPTPALCTCTSHSH